MLQYYIALLVIHIYFFWGKEIKRGNEIVNHRTKCTAIDNVKKETKNYNGMNIQML